MWPHPLAHHSRASIQLLLRFQEHLVFPPLADRFGSVWQRRPLVFRFTRTRGLKRFSYIWRVILRFIHRLGKIRTLSFHLTRTVRFRMSPATSGPRLRIPRRSASKDASIVIGNLLPYYVNAYLVSLNREARYFSVLYENLSIYIKNQSSSFAIYVNLVIINVRLSEIDNSCFFVILNVESSKENINEAQTLHSPDHPGSDTVSGVHGTERAGGSCANAVAE
ncbi:hypothetical protein [Bifidobacterium sp. ESL0704]|uniref:hypothetical protein n=1 Tax=Bifidobacterium sp. ESL0704 TaxID=2983219 RepID=UPI0023F9CBF7|nr:hypothetical protein [Bifidobacterium sp. ESL0704]WEV53816.1 hypothetical protein OZX64_03000 [Bifidobacterium sp. ESL0704]